MNDLYADQSLTTTSSNEGIRSLKENRIVLYCESVSKPLWIVSLMPNKFRQPRAVVVHFRDSIVYVAHVPTTLISSTGCSKIATSVPPVRGQKTNLFYSYYPQR